MKKLLKVLQKRLREIMENVRARIQNLVMILYALALIIDEKINAVANYILKKYEIH